MARRKQPYRSKVKIGVDGDGKPIVKYFQGYTHAELDAAREAVVRRYITGEALSADRLFGDYAAEWFRVRKAPFVSASTRESYRTALNKDLFPRLGDRNLRAVTAMELQEILNGYAGMSTTKITVIIATLRGVFGSAMADRLIASNPTDRLVRPNAAVPKEKRALVPDERRRLEAVCREHPQGHYLALMFYLGCRPGEARGLQWGDIDWRAGRVKIQRDIDYKDGAKAGALKTRASARTVPLPEPLRAILEPLRGFPSAYIAHGEKDPMSPLSKSSAGRIWVELMRAADLAERARGNYGPYDIRREWRATITPHALRHNYITMCWEHGLDPYETMKLVGHTNISTTMNIYTHLTDDQLSKTAAKLNDMFSGMPADAPLNRSRMQL